MARSGVLIKFQLDGDVRRVCVPETTTLTDLRARVAALYSLDASSKLSLKWRDEEDDDISIVEERDWQSAVDENRGRYMRLTVALPRPAQQRQASSQPAALSALCHGIGNEFAARVLQSALAHQAPVTQAAPSSSSGRSRARNTAVQTNTDVEDNVAVSALNPFSNDEIITNTAALNTALVDSPVTVTTVSNCPITQNIFHVQVVDPTSVFTAASVGNGNGNGSGNALNADSFNGNLDGNGNLNGASASCSASDVATPSAKFAPQLRQLELLGFTNTSENIRLLTEFHNNYFAVIDHLLAKH